MSLAVTVARPTFRGALAFLVVGTLGSCYAELEETLRNQAMLVGKQQGHINRQQQAIEAIAEQYNTLRFDHDELSRMVGCSNPQVRDFMRSCVSRQNFVCSSNSVDKALKAMTSIDHVIAYVWPDSPTLALERVGQLKDIIRRHNRLSTSRLLVVTAPAGPGSDDTSRADLVARKLRNAVVQELYSAVRPGEPPLATLPPLFLACNERDEILRRYRTELPNRDSEVKGEPGAKQPRIVLWYFLVDC